MGSEKYCLIERDGRSLSKASRWESKAAARKLAKLKKVAVIEVIK